MLEHFLENGEVVTSVILFGIGLAALLLHKNLIKKIIGLNIMDTAAYLFLAAQGYIEGRGAPIVTDGVTSMDAYINPIPQRPGTHWNCGVCERDSADACSDGLSVSEIPFP